MSHDGKEAMELFESSRLRLNGRFTIGLPWKKDPTQLPNNYPLARLCLESLESSLAKNLVKAQINDKAIQRCEKYGWARELSTDKLATSKNPVYYLPHHGIYHQEKENKPLRALFDPISPYQGVSFNSFLYKGLIPGYSEFCNAKDRCIAETISLY